MNIAARIAKLAITQPDRKASVFAKRENYFFFWQEPRYSYPALNFKELDNLASKYAKGLINQGLKAGDKTLLFVKPSLEFHALVFSLFKVGIVPILIDPGMGKNNLLRAIEESSPTCMIAEPIVHLISKMYPKVFRTINVRVSTKKIPLLCSLSITDLYKAAPEPTYFKAQENDLAAILFTSGGTGRPKGVEYTHGIFETQTTVLQEMFELTNEDIDLPGFPLFSLFTLAMGMSSCVPDMNPSKPAKCDPKKLIQNINDIKATFLAGSPAIWQRVAQYCHQNEIQLPSVKKLAMFGAPVSNELHQIFSKVLPNGDTYTPYGATESLPVTNISGTTILNFTAKLTNQGNGTCVGAAAPGIEIKIIPITDAPLGEIKDIKELPVGAIGEIIVKGSVVTKQYHLAQQPTKFAKIYNTSDPQELWHRMGDLGYLDEQSRLWFCGRKSHRVEASNKLLLPTPCEGVFNNHPGVERSALIGLGSPGKQTPAIIIQRKKDTESASLQMALKEVAKKYIATNTIEQIYFIKNFPVDIRHNIKIDRLKLKKQFDDSITKGKIL